MKKIILASASPRRKELLQRAGYRFEIIPAHTEETITESSPEKIVMQLSGQKAQAVAEESGIKSDKDVLVIGADTIVVKDGQVLGKPKDAQDAYKTLESLAGRIHQVYTGITLLEAGVSTSFAVCTEVEIYPMTKEEIKNYIKTGEPMDKAGSYAIQGLFAVYIKEIHGDYYNVVGLPIGSLYHKLKEMGYYPEEAGNV